MLVYYILQKDIWRVPHISPSFVQTIYESILPANQKLLHKSIGTILLKSSADNPTFHLLAVEQINKYCKDATLSEEERSHYAEINATAAKFSIAESSFEQG